METKKETAAGLEGVSQAERSSLLSIEPSGSNTATRDINQQRDAEVVRSKDKNEVLPKRNLALRILLWMLRKSVIPSLCVIAIVGGMYIGYAVMGKRPASEVFDLATWKHMYDLVFAGS
ncbi:hypothetical protein Back11_52250 [Paenibacillus baekrokdamisoli]|uniref:Uncharacterized protein n=1 Tax=Paenibacillus baekrokdamisoli TaxID=1712516 RepID=A0A3G9IYC8_9BACL|nr:DNA-directed RNA polymerase subunit beta [Paenibacillus baekrokdamisoli]MBB3069062.1 hypothetical protein [Paenibacillus baekrokdamisoli]BBH23880.1 hypothetical protein Back11_52250 [Paenibacillus baekrokdamisoli]